MCSSNHNSNRIRPLTHTGRSRFTYKKYINKVEDTTPHRKLSAAYKEGKGLTLTITRVHIQQSITTPDGFSVKFLQDYANYYTCTLPTPLLFVSVNFILLLLPHRKMIRQRRENLKKKKKTNRYFHQAIHEWKHVLIHSQVDRIHKKKKKDTKEKTEIEYKY